ncbi:uncharacterized protein LOC108632606 [Ceratina calcarata]|uniref:Uncharacterized protein LOC108632606 n=1 Tax=Ceratina calcarata TaxID=156304 RepID=A0AAJ7SCJ5_9HYME|nr:uncharacterized protein LOC108632606 [Ceratina calcarata]XP_026675600.1 uncharacterized protein LOC108632606 [Ceratina calcarata]XP_026675601.1 uncharacterized protein LOC108632606 [Ceratina calcarata]
MVQQPVCTRCAPATHIYLVPSLRFRICALHWPGIRPPKSVSAQNFFYFPAIDLSPFRSNPRLNPTSRRDVFSVSPIQRSWQRTSGLVKSATVNRAGEIQSVDLKKAPLAKTTRIARERWKIPQRCEARLPFGWSVQTSDGLEAAYVIGRPKRELGGRSHVTVRSSGASRRLSVPRRANLLPRISTLIRFTPVPVGSWHTSDRHRVAYASPHRCRVGPIVPFRLGRVSPRSVSDRDEKEGTRRRCVSVWTPRHRCVSRSKATKHRGPRKAHEESHLAGLLRTRLSKCRRKTQTEISHQFQRSYHTIVYQGTRLRCAADGTYNRGKRGVFSKFDSLA